MGELAKARLLELVPNGNNWDEGDKSVTVQFNPTSLKVSYSNQLTGGDQAGGSSKQFVGQSTTKMSLELWFDTTDDGSDVREKTMEVAYFIQPKDTTQDGKQVKIPPRVRFHWGSFLFDGNVDSVDETLELWSEDGIPLRASTALAMSEKAFEFKIDRQAPRSGAGTAPATAARSGETLQQLIERSQSGSSWQAAGEKNGIDNPRQLKPGTAIHT